MQQISITMNLSMGPSDQYLAITFSYFTSITLNYRYTPSLNAYKTVRAKTAKIKGNISDR